MKEPGDTYFECLKCKKKYCLDCQVEWHAGVSCEKYKKWAAENNQADQLFDKYKHNSKGKDCPKCKRYIEKTNGCDHMRCRCGTEFCYSCGMIRAPNCPCDVKRRREVDNDGRIARALLNREQEMIRNIALRRGRQRARQELLETRANQRQNVAPPQPFPVPIFAPPVVQQVVPPAQRPAPTFTELLFTDFAPRQRPAPIFLDDEPNVSFDLSEFNF
jgi:hypothetical protein